MIEAIIALIDIKKQAHKIFIMYNATKFLLQEIIRDFRNATEVFGHCGCATENFQRSIFYLNKANESR